MVFNSIDFLIFFPIVVSIYYIVPRKIKYIWLLIASYYFYMCWNAKYVLLIATSTLITYLSGILISHAKKICLKKMVVAGSFISNLGILAVFKYFDFFIENLNKLLSAVGISTVSNPFTLLLPVGISFYTFQALSYTMDVYKGDIEPEKNPLKYALFVSFFPQLVAGPIERSKNLLAQIKDMGERRLFEYNKFVSGFSLMVWGMFQKMVIADRISIFVDECYANLYACGTVETVVCAIAFSIQIYCDFAGYSSIAIGAAKICGFELMENFNAPYLATSISDFWRRWHISLSTWFRDYLYIPLGGNRKGRIRKYINLMLTFLVSGLWHGAAWTYVVWGGLHGLYQVVGDLTKGPRDRINKFFKVNEDAFSFTFGKRLITFCLTGFAWIFFRAESISQAFYYINRMFTKFNPWVLFNDRLYTLGLDRFESNILFVSIMVMIFVDILRYVKKVNFGDFLVEQNLWFRWTVLILLIGGCLVYGQYGINFDSNQFIYFRF